MQASRQTTQPPTEGHPHASPVRRPSHFFTASANLGIFCLSRPPDREGVRGQLCCGHSQQAWPGRRCWQGPDDCGTRQAMSLSSLPSLWGDVLGEPREGHPVMAGLAWSGSLGSAGQPGPAFVEPEGEHQGPQLGTRLHHAPGLSLWEGAWGGAGNPEGQSHNPPLWLADRAPSPRLPSSPRRVGTQ